MNRKARIILKEGRGAMMEYGRVLLGYIKDLTETYNNDVKDFIHKYSCQLLLVEDEFGEKSLIPCEDIETIQYV